MWFLYLLFSLIFPSNLYAATTDVSATILTNNPPTITFITPVNGQTGVPSDADIVVEISNATYGVDINSVEIIINGVTYLASSPRVSVTGDILDYTFTVTPYDPLFTDQANTVLVRAANFNGNFAQASIVFNVPVITPTPTPTTTPTITPTTTQTPTPTPTGTSVTNTPTPTPTSSATSTSTPTPTPIPTSIYTKTPTPTPRTTSYLTPTPKITSFPTSTYPNCPICPTSNCSLTPTSFLNTTPTPTLPPVPDIVSPIITFIQPASKGFLKTNADFIVQISDISSGVNKDTIKFTINNQVFTLANTQLTATGNSQSFRVTLKNNFQLLPNTEYKISVSAFDLEQNGLSKSIFFQVNKPFPFISLLLIFPIGLLGWFIYFLFHSFGNSKDSQTIGLVFNSLTLEPIPFVVAHINNKKYISNIFGILSVKLISGEYHLTIKDKNFAFPSKNTDQPLDFPKNYTGEAFELKPNSAPFLNIALDPYKDKNIFYKISQKIIGKPGTITNSTGIPLTGIKLALMETKFKTIITSRVVDNEGHYRFVVPHGRYKLIVFGTDTIIDTIDTRHRVFGYTLINKNYIIK